MPILHTSYLNFASNVVDIAQRTAYETLNMLGLDIPSHEVVCEEVIQEMLQGYEPGMRVKFLVQDLEVSIDISPNNIMNPSMNDEAFADCIQRGIIELVERIYDQHSTEMSGYEDGNEWAWRYGTYTNDSTPFTVEQYNKMIQAIERSCRTGIAGQNGRSQTSL